MPENEQEYMKKTTQKKRQTIKKHGKNDTKMLENCPEKMTQQMPETDPKFHRKVDTENAKKRPRNS